MRLTSSPTDIYRRPRCYVLQNNNQGSVYVECTKKEPGIMRQRRYELNFFELHLFVHTSEMSATVIVVLQAIPAIELPGSEIAVRISSSDSGMKPPPRPL